jgi:hypothetical protein
MASKASISGFQNYGRLFRSQRNIIIILDFCFDACVNSGLFACLGIFLIIPIQGIFSDLQDCIYFDYVSSSYITKGKALPSSIRSSHSGYLQFSLSTCSTDEGVCKLNPVLLHRTYNIFLLRLYLFRYLFIMHLLYFSVGFHWAALLPSIHVLLVIWDLLTPNQDKQQAPVTLCPISTIIWPPLYYFTDDIDYMKGEHLQTYIFRRRLAYH